MRIFFINRNGQLRSGWKIFIVLSASIALTLLLVKISTAIYSGADNPVFLMFLQSFAVLLVIYLSLRLIDHKTAGDIGLTALSGHRGELIYGLAAGALSVTVVFLIITGTGNATVVHSPGKTGFSVELIYGMTAFAVVALSEELLFRGYFISALGQVFREWPAVIISSLLFALAHIGNQAVTLLAVFNIFLVGLLFAYMFLKTGSLWMPMGFHFTWNYFQGYVFGLSVSGHEVYSLYTVTVKNNILTGGAFGPEGGLLVTAVLILGFLAVRLYRTGEDVFI